MNTTGHWALKASCSKLHDALLVDDAAEALHPDIRILRIDYECLERRQHALGIAVVLHVFPRRALSYDIPFDPIICYGTHGRSQVE